jgi:hypothetical protein
MERTNKHVGAPAKPVQQPAFKTPAQELEEFKAKVLGMRNGLLIWVDLDARLSMNETCQQAQDDGPLIRDAYSFSEWWQALEAVVPVKELPAAAGEIHRQVAELWPEYKRLLERNPDALKTYNKRYEQNRILRKVRRGDRELQGPGRTRKLAARDARIAHMHDVQGCSFGQIARKLKIYDKHGAPSGAKAYSAYRRYKVESETKFPPNSDTET